MSSALPTIRQLKYLIALSETLNFRQASEKLFITQSTLSSGIKELEESLGVILVERTKRSVRLTVVGLEILRRAQSIVSEVHDLGTVTENFKKPLSAELRLGVIPTIAPFLLPMIIPAIKINHPKLKLYLREDYSQKLIEQIQNGILDFAIIALPFDTNNLATNSLFKDEFWWVAKKGQKLTELKEISIEDINLSELLLLEEGHCLRDHAIEACSTGKMNPNKQSFAATSLYTLIQMIDSGLGCTLLPEMIVKSGALSGTDLIARPFSNKPPFREIALIKRKGDNRKIDFSLLADLIISEKKRYSPRLGASRIQPLPSKN